MRKGKKKKKVALIFGITKESVFVLANALVGLKRHNDKFWDDIIIYHNGVSNNEQKSLEKILDVKFVDLSGVAYLNEIEKENTEIANNKALVSFYKIEAFKLLKDYHRIIWNDADVLIQDDISELADYGAESGLAFGSPFPELVMGSCFKSLTDAYEMFCPLWNTRIMVMSDKLENYMELYDWCKKFLEENSEKLVKLDFAIFNILLQEFSIVPESINSDKYVCPLGSKLAKEATIVHADAQLKFWNNLECMRKYPEWTQNAIVWSHALYVEIKDKVPLVSCIMSCYERYDYLVDSINSILAQTYANFEIIVVLEKSKSQEKIAEVLDGIKDTRIRIIKNTKKLGFAASLNVGLDVAKGKYIARMDDDDLSAPLRFAMQVDYMEKHENVGIVGSNMVVFGKIEDKFLVFSENKYIKAAALLYSPFMHPTVMMRKSMLEEYDLRYDPGYFTEDYELWSRAVYLFDVVNLTDCLVYYRLHTSQATGQMNDLKIHNSHKQVMRNQLKKHLKLDLTENEIETLQPRKDSVRRVFDVDGALALREKTIKKVLDANKELRVYDEQALAYVIRWGSPTGIGNMVETKEMSEKRIKSGLKNVLKPVVNPIYGRLVGKMERMMMAHDEELRANLQVQIDDIKKRIKGSMEHEA